MDEQLLTRTERVRLLEADPDLGAELSPEQREYVERVLLRTVTVRRGPVDPEALLHETGSFAAVILEGVLLHRIAIAEQPALRLLGPGDLLSRAGRPRTSLVVGVDHRAGENLRLAMLDDGVLLAACRAPRLFAGLHTRLGEQHQRLAAQLAICQLPRVDERLRALMWLLAEVWGRVTPSGTMVPIALTHDALGEMIGARRPTVTLALKRLSRRGSLVRRDDGWLLLEPPPRTEAARGAAPARPGGGTRTPSPWPERAPERPSQPSFEALSQIVEALREGDARAGRDRPGRIDRTRDPRDRNRRLRDQIAAAQLRRRRADDGPSAPAPPHQ